MIHIKPDKIKQIIAKSAKPIFEANPLDVNLAKIQFSLAKRLEREIPEHGDFAKVVERYISKDPTLNISTIEVLCRKSNIESKKDMLRTLELNITDKAGINTYSCELINGDKNEILKAVNEKSFFETCKALVLEVEKGVK